MLSKIDWISFLMNSGVVGFVGSAFYGLWLKTTKMAQEKAKLWVLEQTKEKDEAFQKSIDKLIKQMTEVETSVKNQLDETCKSQKTVNEQAGLVVKAMLRMNDVNKNANADQGIAATEILLRLTEATSLIKQIHESKQKEDFGTVIRK